MDTKHAEALPRHAHRGLTLIESAIALAVTAIAAATVAPSLAGFIETRRLDGAATRLAADIQFVRSEAIARNRSLRLSVRSTAGGSTCWIAHTGSAAQCDCSDSGAAVCSGGAAALKTVVLPAGEHVAVLANVGSIVFDPLHGTSTPTGTLRLVAASGRAVHHVVNVVGRVRSCSPSAAVPGYPGC